MPDGVLILEWNERSGIDILAQFPKDIGVKITKETLLHVVNMHAFDETSGTVGLSTDEVNFASYYCGEELEYYVMIILNILENPEDYEDKVEEIAQIVIDHKKGKDFIDILPMLYDKVSK